MFSSQPVEALESRKLLSATLKGGMLRAVGDEGVANTIIVKLSTDKSKYDVEINGQTTSFAAGKVRRIVLHGAEMADTMTVDSAINVRQNFFGYEGNDTLTGGSAADASIVKHGKSHGPRGWTRLWGMGGDDTILATGGRNFIDGGAGNDNITGSDGRDLIAGFTGNDTINANGGNDIVHGGAGDDYIDLGTGNDRALAGAGNDNVKGGDGDDRLFGQDGNDTLDGGAGDDRLYGQLGIDSLLGGDGNDRLLGGDASDIVNGGAGSNKIRTGEESESDELEEEVKVASI